MSINKGCQTWNYQEEKMKTSEEIWGCCKEGHEDGLCRKRKDRMG